MENPEIPFDSAPSRRSYIGWLMGLCTAGVGALLAIPLVRFAIYPLAAETTKTASVSLAMRLTLARNP